MIMRRVIHKARRSIHHLMWKMRWGGKSFAMYQRQEMNRRSGIDAQEAVGGVWDGMGELQLQILREQALRPSDTVLDIGCGSLRGGRKIIPYLEPGHYWGTDISDRLLQSAKETVEIEGLSEKSPHLLQVTDFSYSGLEGHTFSHILFFGVFTDLPPESIELAIAGLPRLMTEESVVLATFGLSDNHTADYRHIRFRQPIDFYEDLAVKSGLQIELVPGFSHRHPKGHSLLRMSLNAGDN